MPTWPAVLPDPVYDQIRIGAPVNAVIRTQNSKGPANQRPRTTAAARPVSLVFEPVSQSALAVFDAFYESDLGYGALAFDMPHPITDEIRSFRFVQEGEPFGVVPVGVDAYQISASLELLP